MHIDKHKAKKNLWRIPESTLMGFAIAGGSLGCLLGMHSARHKTKHLKFRIGLPVIFAIQVILVVICFPFLP
jgi:uncharacterized membrane protein YsdA (DUF1294 family)